MTLDSITIANYKNIAEAQLDFSPGVNCLIGNNGMGKTNVLDTVYYLSFCKSYRNTSEKAAVIKHGEDFMMLKGCYTRRGAAEQISVAMQRNKRKTVRRNGKEYARLSQHIGLLPLVMVSPTDWDLIRGQKENSNGTPCAQSPARRLKQKKHLTQLAKTPVWEIICKRCLYLLRKSM